LCEVQRLGCNNNGPHEKRTVKPSTAQEAVEGSSNFASNPAVVFVFLSYGARCSSELDFGLDTVLDVGEYCPTHWLGHLTGLLK
jgi:hypothetical protein